MSRSTRMFEIIQLLRSARQPMTAQAIATALEVTKRTVYRDIATLQARRVPILGEAGVGYVMRSGYDLPPLMFTSDEIEAIVVGLALIGRTGDSGLQDAAESAGRKIGNVLPDGGQDLSNWPLFASNWHAVPDSTIDPTLLREAIRDEAKLRLLYADVKGDHSTRLVLPLALIYYVDSLVLAAWCELRQDFRHFRIDRIVRAEATGDRFTGTGDALRRDWQALQRQPATSSGKPGA